MEIPVSFLIVFIAVFVFPPALRGLWRAGKGALWWGKYLAAKFAQKMEDKVLWAVFIFMIGIWVLGTLTRHTLYGYLHILFPLAVALAFIQIFANGIPGKQKQ